MTDRETGLLEQGRRLAAWRSAQKDENGKILSQDAAAKRIGSSQSAWAGWEVGRNAPSSWFAKEIAKLTRGKVRADGWVFRVRAPVALPKSA